MQQELAFLDHLLRLIGGDGSGAYQADGAPGAATIRAGRQPAPRPRPGGLTAMTIPTFTGYDTALRGLEAEQIAIDTTGQNIDNASTPGYSREAVDLLGPSAPLALQAESSVNSGAVNLGTGVDADDDQPRAQPVPRRPVPRSEHHARQRQRDGHLADPGAGCVQRARRKRALRGDVVVLQRLGKPRQRPDERGRGRRVARRQRASRWPASSTRSTPSCTTVQTQAGTQLSDLTASNGQLASDANQIAQLNGEINQQLGAGQNPNTLEDQRDSLIDDMSSLGTVSVTDPGNGLLQITFGGNSHAARQRHHRQLAAADAHGGHRRRARRTWPASSDTTATGAISPYLTQLNTVASNLISTVNGITDAASLGDAVRLLQRHRRVRHRRGQPASTAARP